MNWRAGVGRGSPVDPVALVFVVLRFGPDAVIRLMAGAVALLTRDQKRARRALNLLRILRPQDKPTPVALMTQPTRYDAKPPMQHIQ